MLHTSISDFPLFSLLILRFLFFIWNASSWKEKSEEKKKQKHFLAMETDSARMNVVGADILVVGSVWNLFVVSELLVGLGIYALIRELEYLCGLSMYEWMNKSRALPLQKKFMVLRFASSIYVKIVSHFLLRSGDTGKTTRTIFYRYHQPLEYYSNNIFFRQIYDSTHSFIYAIFCSRPLKHGK